MVNRPSGADNWRGPYLKQMPKDPWGNPYAYIREGSSYEVISYGADGQSGGSDIDQDITSSDVE